ncbi:hypothetical protein [uncultured Clostridium sp.]|uniref:hypothetical protein n=1 Tax=uncultured Clostridium sp. TaxID=59620 RepID=UPI0028E76FC0|nr:hypothetical protein [uncultured Clostridium sp.]
MNLKEMIEDFRKSTSIKFIATSEIVAKCPHCGEEFLIGKVTNDKLEYTLWRNIDSKGYAYNDGDTIMGIEKGIELGFNQYDAQLLQGECIKCHGQYVGISILVTNKPTKEDFYICDDEIFNEESVSTTLYSIEVNGEGKGHLVVYRNVYFKGNNYDMYEIRIDGIINEVDLRSECGISNCNLSKEQDDIWEYARVLSQTIISELIKNEEFNIAAH